MLKRVEENKNDFLALGSPLMLVPECWTDGQVSSNNYYISILFPSLSAVRCEVCDETLSGMVDVSTNSQYIYFFLVSKTKVHGILRIFPSENPTNALRKRKENFSALRFARRQVQPRGIHLRSRAARPGARARSG